MPEIDEELKDRVEIVLVSGIEGLHISINNFRVCGSKAWGGGKVIKKWEVSIANDIIPAIKAWVDKNYERRKR